MPWLERVRNSQPIDAGIGLDGSNPLTRGLVFCAAPNVDVITGTRSTPYSGGSLGVSPAGVAVVSPNTSSSAAEFAIPTSSPVYQLGTEYTQIVVGSVTGSANYSGAFHVLHNLAVNPPYYAIFLGSPANGSTSQVGYANGSTWTSVDGAAGYWSTPTTTAYAYTRKGTSVSIYKAGALASSLTLPSNAAPNFVNNCPVRILTTKSGNVAFAAIFNRSLSALEIASISANPWQLFEKERIWVPVAAGGPVTHDTSGALTGQLGSIAGTAAHVAVHGTSGTPTGQLGSVVGSAARLRAFASTGALTGPGSAVVGSATRAGGTTTHDATGTPTGQGSAVVGTAAHVAIHGTSGTLVGTSALLAGTAVHNIPHGTSGDLTGPGSVVVGSALNGLASVTKSGVNRLWLIDYYTKEFAAKEKLRNPEPAKTKAVSKKRAAVVAAKVEASVAKAEKDLVTLTKSMKDVQDAQVFIYNAIQQAKQAPQAESVDFMAVAKRYEKKMQQEEHELLLLAMVL